MKNNTGHIGGLPERTAATLREIANAAVDVSLEVKTPITITLHELFSQISDKARRKIVRDWQWPSVGETVIYRIGHEDEHLLQAMAAAGKRLCDDRKVAQEQHKEEQKRIKAKGDNATKIKRPFEMAKINGYVEGETSALYIGQSHSTTSRMEWHLGVTNPSAYALHFLRWLPEYDKKILDMSIKVELWTVPRTSPTLHERIAQAFEDQLWDECKPLFGKQGAH